MAPSLDSSHVLGLGILNPDGHVACSVPAVAANDCNANFDVENWHLLIHMVLAPRRMLPRAADLNANIISCGKKSFNIGVIRTNGKGIGITINLIQLSYIQFFLLDFFFFFFCFFLISLSLFLYVRMFL